VCNFEILPPIIRIRIYIRIHKHFCKSTVNTKETSQQPIAIANHDGSFLLPLKGASSDGVTAIRSVIVGTISVVLS